MSQKADKHDGQKEIRPELLAPEFLTGIAKVLAFGANKYSVGNWANGMEWSRIYGALQRHIIAWAGGENSDSESGFSHLFHAGCCLMFLVAHEARELGIDDRATVGLM